MAVVIVNNMQGGSQETYDAVTPKVMPGNQLPQGCQLHVAGPTEDGWRVITVWDSAEQFEQFRNEKLIPALREAGAGDRIAPSISTDPAYKVVTA
jgi:heme-degrading monooxygenase HmoA